jgi:hypothetical protein
MRFRRQPSVPTERSLRTNASPAKARAFLIALVSSAALAAEFLGVTWVLSRPEPVAPKPSLGSAIGWPEIKNGVPDRVAGEGKELPGRFERPPMSTVGPASPMRSDAGYLDQQLPTLSIDRVEEGAPRSMAAQGFSTTGGALVAPLSGSAQQHAPELPPQPDTIETSQSDNGGDRRQLTDRAEEQSPPTEEQQSPAALARLPGATPREARTQGSPASVVSSESESSRPKPKLRSQKPATTRTRTASRKNQREKPTDQAAPPAVAAAPDAERSHLLGIPLPTRREIKDCLLEFRC